MTKKSVIFIEPVGNESSVFDKYMQLPLMGTLYLGTILHNEGYDVRIYNENILQRKIDPFEIQADVICISALTVSANRARLLARELKRINPQSKVIVGGIHASLLPQEFEDVADHVVFGEAESIIVDLVEGRFSEKRVSGAPLEDLDKLPVVNYGLIVNSDSMSIIPVMTSRGCPFDCNFCTVTKIFGKRFRVQSPERVVEEVKNAIAFFGPRYIFFYDDNFTANRERVKELCDRIEQAGLVFSWNAQVRSDVARDPELVERMERAGCRRFFIGFESINDETLKAMHKSQTRADIEHAIAVIRRRGIGIHGMFIIGEDHDTPESIKATVDFAITHHIDTVQFMILTPFPGTRLCEGLEKENRLIHTQWDYYDGMYAVFHPRNMSPSRLQLEMIRAYERFYSIRRVSTEMLRLTLDIFVDALTWNFRRVYWYSFESALLKAGARFLVGRSMGLFERYIRQLEETSKKQAAPDAGIT